MNRYVLCLIAVWLTLSCVQSVRGQEVSQPKAVPFSEQELNQLGWFRVEKSSSWTRTPPSSSVVASYPHGASTRGSCRWCGQAHSRTTEL